MCNVIFLSIRGTILLTSFSSSEKGGKKDPVERKHLIMLSFFKSESKSITIPDRPNPPSFDLMKEDVESAPDNDLMFRTRSRKFTWHSAIYNLRKYKPGPYVTGMPMKLNMTIFCPLLFSQALIVSRQMNILMHSQNLTCLVMMIWRLNRNMCTSRL